MTDRCEYCGQEERYGHNAVCVMNEVERLRAVLIGIAGMCINTHPGEEPAAKVMRQAAIDAVTAGQTQDKRG
ncbi:hypothetical protein EHM76_00300 [bacterium]|nr:MAG: hypothetical protein EHM76_00300 [bacterium]